jgi:hypothetical protein
MIRKATDEDFDEIFNIINDAAIAYKGVIPHMTREELQSQIEDGVRFSCYEKHGFRLVEDEEKDRLLKKYWAIPDRQVETSVVLVDGKYKGSNEI